MNHPPKDSERNTERQDLQTEAVIGAAMAVHRELGHGFLEAVYQEALAQEFEVRGIPFANEVPLPIRYRGKFLATRYRCDFLCFDSVLVELKAQTSVGGVEFAQVLNYLKATGLRTALLFNFGVPQLGIKRISSWHRTVPGETYPPRNAEKNSEGRKQGIENNLDALPIRIPRSSSVDQISSEAKS